MKRNLTRIFCLVLALLLSAAVFSGCKKEQGDGTSSTADDVTSTAPPAVVQIESEGYDVLEGTDVVTVVKDNTTNDTTMMVATDTTLGTFKTVVTAREGYNYKIFDAAGVEVIADPAVITNGSKFMLYKDGETEAKETYNISVVTKDQIASTISEIKAEESRYESQLAEASKNSIPNSTASGASVAGPSGVSGGRSEGGITSTGASSRDVVASPLNGYTLEWRTHYNEDRVGTTDKALMYQRVAKGIDAKYDMTTKIIYDPTANEASSIANAVMSGEKYADIIETQIYTIRALAKQGALCDLYSSSTLNKSDGRFDNGATRGATFQGKAYGVSFGGMNPSINGITFNKEQVALYAPDIDIYQLYKQGEWKVEKYTELIAACSKNLDANPNTYEIFGVTSNTNIIGIALTGFCGSTAYRDPATGFIKPGFITSSGIESLEWCKTLYNSGYWKYMADIFQSINFFASGSAATVVTSMHAVMLASSVADFEVGFIAFPKAGNQTKHVHGAYDATMYAVPSTNSKNLDKVCLYINELYALNEPLVEDAVKMYSNAGLDEIGCSFLRWSLNNSSEEYSTNIFTAAISTPIDTSVTDPSKTPAAEMDRIASLAQAELDDYYGLLTGQGK